MLYLHNELVADDQVGPIRILNYKIIVPYWEQRLDSYPKPLLSQVVGQTRNVRSFK